MLGGIHISSMTKKYLTTVKTLHDLEPLMFKMEAEDIWEMVERNVMLKHSGGNKGLMHVFVKNIMENGKTSSM